MRLTSRTSAARPDGKGSDIKMRMQAANESFLYAIYAVNGRCTRHVYMNRKKEEKKDDQKKESV